ncbi:LysR family transcriptional regulator [Sphingobium cupriresistens]|uniref:LysR family transcriptional regulator n=1 Tax=Sphingobium cupriresistens TaxID=1132417 RepID=A0A8G1ZFI1_9SPHN|nr:LysR family transcriptional regulator [Sphingobium cupriresistens]RYM09987.1 LysR family transcriptional regulator [Sphingobium cupriresistens]
MHRWEGIDEFVAIAAAGSFKAGAEALGLSTTHMSRAIAALEARVQAPLFHRTTRTVRLTDTGRVFFDHCSRIVAERDEAIAMISEGGEPQGDIRITCSTAMGERFIAPIVRRYASSHAKLRISIDLTNRLVDLVGEGYDLAIRTGQLAESRLIGTRIASRRLHTCAAPAYLDRHGRPAKPGDLSRHECLVGTSPLWRFERGGRAESIRPKGRWRCNSGGAVAEAAIAGMGVCQLPEFYLLPHIASGALEEVLDDFRPDDEPIWAVYPQRRHLLPKISGLLDLLRAELPAALARQA